MLGCCKEQPEQQTTAKRKDFQAADMLTHLNSINSIDDDLWKVQTGQGHPDIGAQKHKLRVLVNAMSRAIHLETAVPTNCQLFWCLLLLLPLLS